MDIHHSDIKFKFEELADSGTRPNNTYQLAVFLKDDPISKVELLRARALWPEMLKQNRLNGIAFIQKLASVGDQEALDLREIYQAYREFLSTRDLAIFQSHCEAILSSDLSTPLTKDIASYIRTLITKAPLNDSLLAAKEYADLLIPNLDIIIETNLQKIHLEQMVKIDGMQAPHNAFPDLIKFEGHYYAAFREALSHVRHNDLGKIRLLKGDYDEIANTWQWTNEALIEDKSHDLRDPKFFVNNQGELMLILDGSIINKDHKTEKMVPHVAFKERGEWKIVLAAVDSKGDGPKGQWLWRVTWNPYDHFGYSLSYGKDESLTLLKTSDGFNYEKVTDISCDRLKEPYNEATLRFKSDGTLIALIRTQKGGLIATATQKSGYTKWDFNEVPFRLGGPNFLISELDQRVWAGTRHFFLDKDNVVDFGTALAQMTDYEMTPLLRLKSEQDNSYPGMVLEDHTLSMIYYSTIKTAQEQDESHIFIVRLKI